MFFQNKYQMVKASDEDIQEFFANTVFEGVFSAEIKSSHSDRYKGHIHSIKINGEPTNVIGAYINVPIYAKDISEGECTFKCRVREEVRLTPSQINFYLSPKTLRSKNALSVGNPRGLASAVRTLKNKSVLSVQVAASTGEVSNNELFARWGVKDCQCIAFYYYDKEKEVYLIDDLRKPNFVRIPYYPNDEEKRPVVMYYPHEIRGIKPNNYYLFTWKLAHTDPSNPFKIFIDFSTPPKEIEPKWFIDTLFNDRHDDTSKNFDSATNFLDTLSKQLSASDSTFVYELLQNANDYPEEGKKVDVEFHITKNYLLFMHSGAKFNVRNISGICGINEKEKVANKTAIGYKGIGFKTVFLNNHYVYLHTGEYSFRFDEKAKKIKRLEAPWPILPVWTEKKEVADEVNSVFESTSDKFKVQIALRPDKVDMLHRGQKCYENLFKEVFEDSNIILFIPNINSVRVVIDGQEVRLCNRNNAKWIVNDYEEKIDEELQNLINRTIETGKSRIPEKYKDFGATRISFACKKNENKEIETIEDSILYCYLPTKATWGFPFLMNTDMIPKGDRNDIETEVELLDENSTNFNIELAGIAGAKLFNWIYDLLRSGSKLGSIFALVPDFKTSIKEHKEYADYISRFQDSFEKMLDERPIVPINGGIAKVSDVIYDETNLSTSGILKDEEFYSFANFDEENKLPFHSLRTDERFKKFHHQYVYEENVFNAKRLRELIRGEQFKDWLKNQNNNNKFLGYLLDNDYLKEFCNEKIFIEDECGDLYSASELYYDIDDELKDLSAFSRHLCYLSLKTRAYFKDNEKWNEVILDNFADFDGSDFIKNTLLKNYKSETLPALADWETSYHFYHYLAANGIVPDNLCDLSFFNDDEELVDNFQDKFVFTSSPAGKATCASAWLTPIIFYFVSRKYDTAVIDYLKANAKIRDYSDEIIANEVLLSEDYQEEINEAQQEDENISLSFMRYCFEHKELFGEGSLRRYALKAVNCGGDEGFILSEDHVFFPSACFDAYSSKQWLDEDWMHCLSSMYLQGDEVKKFLKKAFCIEELDDKKFYREIVKGNIKGIITNTSENNDADGEKNFDFVKYLDANYKLVFDDERDQDIFGSFVLLGEATNNDLYDIDTNAKHVYAYNPELEQIMESEWFPEDTISMCSSRYGQSKSIIAIKAKRYNFGEFFSDVIAVELASINNAITSKEASIAFHTFVIDRLTDLTGKQKEVMKKAKVFLYENNEAAKSSGGHYILSKSAKDLASMGLVEFSDLNIIDPDYSIEGHDDYWKTCLGNEPFTMVDFVKWLKEHIDVFYAKIKDKENNIKFWRWLKGCNLSDQTLRSLPALPIYLKCGISIASDATIYLSDDYIVNGGLETIVKNYNAEADFVSPDYIDDGGKESWKDFWVQMGIRYEMIDILIDTIDNRLADTEDDKLPATIAKYRSKLEDHYEGDLISKIKGLRVKAHNGEFYSLADVIYVDCEKEEPFKFIGLPNQTTFATADERRLIIEIIGLIGGQKINNLKEWQEAKFERYQEIQSDKSSEDVLRLIHYKFIDELAAMYADDRDSLKIFEDIKDLWLLDSDGNFKPAAELTEGSVYSPFCDFEKFGLRYVYLSNSYKTECENDIRKMLNRIFKVHCDFKKDDIQNLSNRAFAIYFWNQYVEKRDADIVGLKKLIEDREFDSVPCIPTKDCMKNPTEIYAPIISSYVAKHIDDWENKLPLNDLPEVVYDDEGRTLFGLLLNKPSNLSLSFHDSLTALFTIKGQDRRAQLLSWMIESYNESFDIVIDEYRSDESACWKNSKNEDVHISKLYALAYGDKMLEQYFGTLPQIINKDYFPAGPDAFRKACDILKVTTIESGDLIVSPENKESSNAKYIQSMKIYALVIAGYEDFDHWDSRYKDYCHRIDEMNFWCCSAISLCYKENEEICQTMKKFYHEKDSTDFFFVQSLDGKRVFKPFVESFIDYLNIEADADLVESIMDGEEAALELAKEHNTLMLDESFKSALDELRPGIKKTLSGKEANDQDMLEDDRRHIFNGHSKDNIETGDDTTRDVDGREATNVSIENDATIDENPIYNSPENDSDEHIEEEYDIPRSGGNSPSTDGMPNSHKSEASKSPRKADRNGFNTEKTANTGDIDDGGYIGSVEKDSDYDPIGDAPCRPFGRKAPKPFTKEEINRLRSHSTPLELESLPATAEEINALGQMGIQPEQIADTNYLAQLRLYANLRERGEEPEESLENFVRNANDVSMHALKGGKYIHSCSAARGVMYVSPSVWNKMIDNKWRICVYLDGQGKNFHYINDKDEFLHLVEKDDVVIKITGKEKVEVVKALYSGLLENVKGTAYTLVRVAAQTNMDAVFAHYVGSMAEPDDGNEY